MSHFYLSEQAWTRAQDRFAIRPWVPKSLLRTLNTVLKLNWSLNDFYQQLKMISIKKYSIEQSDFIYKMYRYKVYQISKKGYLVVRMNLFVILRRVSLCWNYYHINCSITHIIWAILYAAYDIPYIIYGWSGTICGISLILYHCGINMAKDSKLPTQVTWVRNLRPWILCQKTMGVVTFSCGSYVLDQVL